MTIDDFSFATQNAVANNDYLRLFLSSLTQRTLTISVPRNANRTNTVGQVFDVNGGFLTAVRPSPFAGVTFTDGARSFNGVSGKVTISQLGYGPIGDGLPGALTFQLSEVVLVADASTGATGTFRLTGPFTATSGTTSFP